MPGKRVKVGTIEELPDAEKVGPYRNILIHTGINNLNSRNNRRSNGYLVEMLENKCDEYMKLYPQAKIYISLLLPTKLNSLNHLVREFNELLLDFTYKHKKLYIIDHSIFGNKLSDEHGRYDTREGCFNNHDFLHLGKSGLRLFANRIKKTIFGKRDSNSRQRHSAGQGNYSAAVSRGSTGAQRGAQRGTQRGTQNGAQRGTQRVAQRGAQRGGSGTYQNRGDQHGNRFASLADLHD